MPPPPPPPPLWERAAKVLGFNPVQIRWWLHRRHERARQVANERENRRRVLSYEHKVCAACGLTVDRNERRCPRCAAALPGAARSRLLRSLRYFVPSGTYTYTSVLVAANVAYYLAMLMRSGGGPASLGRPVDAAVIYRFGAIHPVAVIYEGQAWRLVTAMFLHFDLLHLIFNCLCLLQLGPLMEALAGRSRYLAMYLAAGVSGFAASAAAMFVRGPALSAGASGVVYGLMAAGLIFGYVKKEPGALSFRQGLAKWLVLGVIISLLPGVDLMAHAGGAVAGAAFALCIEPARRPGRGWLVVEISGLGLILGAVVAAWLFPGTPVS